MKRINILVFLIAILSVMSCSKHDDVPEWEYEKIDFSKVENVIGLWTIKYFQDSYGGWLRISGYEAIRLNRDYTVEWLEDTHHYKGTFTYNNGVAKIHYKNVFDRYATLTFRNYTGDGTYGMQNAYIDYESYMIYDDGTQTKPYNSVYMASFLPDK